MPALLEFNGIRITVPTSELAEAIAQLQKLTHLNKSHSTNSAPSTEQKASTVKPTTTLGPIPFAGRTPRKVDDIRAAVEFLEMITGAELFGTRAAPEAAMEVFHVQHARGLGSKLAAVNRLIDSCGFAIPDVYITARDAHGSFWRQSPQIENAIQALKDLATQSDESRSYSKKVTEKANRKNNNLFEEEEVQPQHNEKSP